MVRLGVGGDMFSWLGKRSTGEIMVIAITFTVCASIFAGGIAVTIVAITHPDTDVTVWVTRITGLLNTLVGLLAGFLAGRTDYKNPPPSEENKQP